MDSKTIIEQKALEIVDEFIAELTSNEKHGVLGVYLIGSLGGGYYRPGQSDIDTFILLDGSSPYTQVSIEEIAIKYYEKYHVPKGFGAVAATLKECHSPHEKSIAEDFSFCMEIARLKTQGKPVYGLYPLEDIPIPSREDFIQDETIDQEWFHSEYGYPMFDKLDAPSCINVILSSMRIFLIIERNVFEFNKFKTIEAFQENKPPMVDNEVFDYINAYLRDEIKSDDRILEKLRIFGITLRDHINESILGLFFEEDE